MPDSPNHSVIALELGPMENFVYLLHDHSSNTAAIVDPAWDVEEIMTLAENRGINITDILLTHSHNDHINGIDRVMNQYDARIHLHKHEASFWGSPLSKPQLHHGGDYIKLGDSEIEVLHTPGHTPGSACYKIGDDLIAGDTIFVFGCGRCDRSGGDPEQMYTTLQRMRTELPGHTLIHPGHNYAPMHPTSSMTEQIEGNPFLHFDDSEDFVRYRMHVHDHIRDTPYTEVSRQEALKSLEK